MKEKISQFAKEKFEYDKPELLFSEEKLLLFAKGNGEAQAGFRVRNSMGRKMKGVVYSSDWRLVMENNTFVGEEAEIIATYKAEEGVKEGIRQAHLTVVSNYGVKELPVEIHFEAPFIETSVGKVRDLYQFASLAKKDWDEAQAVFKSSEFRQLIITRNDDRRMYDGLLKSPVTAQAMDEFLTAVHVKKETVLSLVEEEKEYRNIRASIEDVLTVKASEWGYVEASISTDCDFIKLDKDSIESADFADGACIVPFRVEYGRLLCTEERGTITIATAKQMLQVQIVAERARIHTQKVSESGQFLKKKQEAMLVEAYLQFRTSEITKEEYEQKLESALVSLEETCPPVVKNLWKAHLYMINGNKEQLDGVMEEFAQCEKDLIGESLDYYLSYRYLDALYVKEEDQLEETARLFHSYLKTEKKDWRLLWYLLYIDRSYVEDTKKRLEAILAMLKEGVNSPVLYCEAAFAYNKEPQLLLELGTEERRIMHWAVRHRLISRELANQFVFVAARSRKFDRLLLKDLMAVYEYRESAECLQAILRMLITGQMTDNRYFKWYECGVRKNLKITELYEYYMYSINEEEQEKIDHTVLLYFVYNNHLPEAKKAFLYSYILKHKEEIPSVYRTYLRQMESFTRKMALKGSISASLAVLYEEFITPESVDEELAASLPQILFRYELSVDNKNIRSVAVRQQELEEERLLGVDEGRCFISLPTPDATVFFIDVKMNRYVTGISHGMRRLFYKEELVKRCFELNGENLLLLLYMRTKFLVCETGSARAAKCGEITESLLSLDEVSRAFKADHFASVMQQYAIRGDVTKMQAALEKVIPERVRMQDRKTVTDALIMHKQYDKAYRMVTLYGFEEVSTERLFELTCHLLATHLSVANSVSVNRSILLMCDYLYRKGKTNEAILTYLSTHYENTTSEMYRRYVDLKEAGVHVLFLEERIIGQILFSETDLDKMETLFLPFYKESNNKLLIRAYLNYMAYRYVRFDEPITEELCEMMKRESFYHESRVSMLAVLKFYKDKENLSEEEHKLIDYNLHKFIREGVILPFFKEYKDRMKLPDIVTDRTYLAYKAAPDAAVNVCYQIGTAEEMKEERMVNMFEGIFVKDFLLFHGEELHYYVKEQRAGEEKATERKILCMPRTIKEAYNRFDELNIMLEQLEKRDDEALQEQLKQYAIEGYITSSLFTPL